jgi:RNA recognition motif. (a.k.a. RRM, RBD, or RNP domain)
MGFLWTYSKSTTSIPSALATHAIALYSRSFLPPLSGQPATNSLRATTNSFESIRSSTDFMPSDLARRERRRKQFGRPPSEPENSNGVALPASLPSAPPTSSHKDASPMDILPTSGVLLPPSPEAIEEDQDQGSPSSTPKKIEKKSRFILFVGNLPYSATTAGVERHFAPVKPVSIRHSTDKATGRSRGFAFLEFEDVKRMESCLVGWHRSIYREEAPGLSRETPGDGDGADGADGEAGKQAAKHRHTYAREGWRRINVQLT